MFWCCVHSKQEEPERESKKQRTTGGTHAEDFYVEHSMEEPMSLTTPDVGDATAAASHMETADTEVGV